MVPEYLKRSEDDICELPHVTVEEEEACEEYHLRRHQAGQTAAPAATGGRPAPPGTAGVLLELARARASQDARWGAQNFPDGTGPEEVGPGLPYTYRDMLRIAADAHDAASDADDRCMALMLLVKVFAALAEDRPDLLRAEVLHLAVVAVQWIEMIDRRADITDTYARGGIIAHSGVDATHPLRWYARGKWPRGRR